MCVVEKSNKKNYQTKTGKKFNSKQKIEKNLDSLLALIYGKLRRNWIPEKIYYIPLPYHDDDIRYDDHLQIKKKMIVICLLKKNQNDMI